ncbi:HEAT repeat domain-containing protein [bacterium]|nr:HEAT repeat domain-containing protein [bacterium]
MIDDQLLEMLVNNNVEVRKRAVTQLAKTRSREALKYLADVYRDDDNADVRELARKGSLYIKKHLEAAAPAASPPPRSPAPERQLLAADEAPEDEGAKITGAPTVSLSQLNISWEAEKRAKEAVKTAMDYHVRGDNTRAAQHLRTALRENPRLSEDAFTVSLAATLTGLEGPQAVQRFAPSERELLAMTGHKDRNSALEAFMAYTVLVSAVIMLIGYFVFPWVDMGGLETTGLDGESTTVGVLLDEMKAQFDAMRDMVEQSGVPLDETERQLADALGGIRVAFSGFDTALVTLGLRDILDVMGVTALFEAVGGSSLMSLLQVDETALETSAAPVPLDYTLLLLPVVGGAALMVGFLLLRRARVALWIACIGIGLAGVVPLAHFYLSAVGDVLVNGTDLGIFGEAAPASSVALIGLGYWVTLAAVVVIALLPFIALLLTPAAGQADG